MLIQADVNAVVPARWDDRAVQRLDASPTRVMAGTRQAGVDAGIGLVEALVLRSQQAVEYSLDLARVGLQVRHRFPTDAAALHHLH